MLAVQIMAVEVVVPAVGFGVLALLEVRLVRELPAVPFKNNTGS